MQNSFTSPLAPGICNSNWLVGFGDLLTLILCFFVSVISLSSPKINQITEIKHESSANYPDSKLESGDNLQLAQDGTEIAFIDMSEEGGLIKRDFEKIVFYQDQFEHSSYVLRAEPLLSLKETIDRTSYNVNRLKIETCSHVQMSETNESFEESSKLLLALKRQVFDTLPESKGAKVLLGSFSSECRTAESGGRPLAQIVFEFD